MQIDKHMQWITSNKYIQINYKNYGAPQTPITSNKKEGNLKNHTTNRKENRITGDSLTTSKYNPKSTGEKLISRPFTIYLYENKVRKNSSNGSSEKLQILC